MAKKKSNICLSCGHDFNEEYYHINPPITNDDKNDVKLTKEYCEEQSIKYNHKNCKALWCDDCQLLTGYLVNY